MSDVKKNEESMAQAVKEILSGGLTRTVLSVLLGFLVGALFMIGSNKEFIEALGYLFSRPSDALGAAAQVVSEGYGALFRGGTGQLIFGMIFATFVATRLELPFVLHTIVALIAGIVGAALLGALVGFLKARTGAHEVILTIMLNYIALYFFTFLMRNPALLQESRATGNPKADPAAETALLPKLIGDNYSLHWGLIFALLAVVVFWWLMERSTIGFRLRMVGFNPDAARAAGINVEKTYILAMALSAGFVGVAAANQSLGVSVGVTPSAHANIGFDAITVALLGGSSGPGILLAGLLFGAFKAGAPSMQVIGVSPEVLGIVQGAIVLFIAAPPLIRAIFRLPAVQNSNALGAIRKRLFSKGGAK